MFLGRTIGIHEGDFSTPLLDIPPVRPSYYTKPLTFLIIDIQSRTTLKKCGNLVLRILSAVVSRQSRPCTSATSTTSRPFVSVVPTHPLSASISAHDLFVTTDIITGEVLAKVYRVSRANVIPSRTVREQLYYRLTQWSIELPDHLCYSFSSNRPCPAPHVLAMHIQYWATVLLMHRPLYVICEFRRRAFLLIVLWQQYSKRLRVSLQLTVRRPCQP